MTTNNKFIDNNVLKLIQNDSIESDSTLHYSLNQVAALLGETSDAIRYYTNIFDDILKIEIVDKELHYTNNDINKLELLIKLKSKGMTLKEISQYYNNLPINEEGFLEFTENNMLSVKELIDFIVEEENKQLTKFKEELINDIHKINNSYMEQLKTSIIECQNKNLANFKDELYAESMKYIDSTLKSQNEINRIIHTEFTEKIGELISDIIKTNNKEFENSITTSLHNFNENAKCRDNILTDQFRDFKNIINNAYYIQNEIEKEESKAGFFQRIFGHN